MMSEVKKAERLAQATAAAASTDDTGKGRAAHAFNEQLATKLREARLSAAAAKGQATRLGNIKENFLRAASDKRSGES